MTENGNNNHERRFPFAPPFSFRRMRIRCDKMGRSSVLCLAGGGGCFQLTSRTDALCQHYWTPVMMPFSLQSKLTYRFH